MKKLYSIILGFIIFNISLNAQTPSVLGTSIVDGTYRRYDLTDFAHLDKPLGSKQRPLQGQDKNLGIYGGYSSGTKLYQ
ncbi:MAG: hypothetical protein IPO14_09615 [Saprospiraceae bacterium]|nr:hypothetical protein [Saprospiraceae bacterium]